MQTKLNICFKANYWLVSPFLSIFAHNKKTPKQTKKPTPDCTEVLVFKSNKTNYATYIQRKFN